MDHISILHGEDFFQTSELDHAYIIWPTMTGRIRYTSSFSPRFLPSSVLHFLQDSLSLLQHVKERKLKKKKVSRNSSVSSLAKKILMTFIILILDVVSYPSLPLLLPRRL